MPKRLSVVPERCSGCRLCESVCALQHFGVSNPKKAALNLIPHFPAPGVYEMKTCTQCGDCAAVCPTEAIKLNERGAYYVDFDECNLCEACVSECPEDVMYVRAELANAAWKCDLCGDCVNVCGTSALYIAN